MNVLNERKGKKELRWAKVPQTKQDKQREAEEHARMLRRERIMREIELGALNTKRYRTLWREMMMRIKMPRIAEDVEVAWRNFDRALDIKDYRSLHESEDLLITTQTPFPKNENVPSRLDKNQTAISEYIFILQNKFLNGCSDRS